eukprot:9406779-Pyramimonas_sp.AAC.1
MSLIMIAMLEKPEGGSRPIGPLSTVVRVWDAAPDLLLGNGRFKNKRDFFYGSTGMPCERGVWEQAFIAEHARITNTCAGAGLLDLSKAYERALPGHLIDAAQMTKFPLDILRLLSCVYRCHRLLVVGQVASAPVMTEQTIVAGCTFATTLLKVLLVRMLDCVMAEFPFARVYNVVDDITVRVRGSRKFARDMLPVVV